jgi:hypothetical protein
MTGMPPLLPHCQNWTSPSAPRVAEPVEAQSLDIDDDDGDFAADGKGNLLAAKAMPGPEVAVITFIPAMDAPGEADSDLVLAWIQIHPAAAAASISFRIVVLG